MTKEKTNQYNSKIILSTIQTTYILPILVYSWCSVAQKWQYKTSALLQTSRHYNNMIIFVNLWYQRKKGIWRSKSGKRKERILDDITCKALQESVATPWRYPTHKISIFDDISFFLILLLFWPSLIMLSFASNYNVLCSKPLPLHFFSPR